MATPAWKMAADISEGYVTLNPVSLKKYEKHEVDALGRQRLGAGPTQPFACRAHDGRPALQSEIHESLFTL